MTAREQHIKKIRATVANHRKVGNDFMAGIMEPKADAFEAMSDEEYEQHQAANKPTAAMRRSAKRMAAEVFG